MAVFRGEASAERSEVSPKGEKAKPNYCRYYPIDIIITLQIRTDQDKTEQIELNRKLTPVRVSSVHSPNQVSGWLKMAKIMLGYLYTQGLLVPLNKLMISNRGLVRDMMDYYLISQVFNERPTADEIAFHLCEDSELIKGLWNERTQLAWVHAKNYMDKLIEERNEFQEEKVAAGLASGEARKKAVTLKEAEEILGKNFSVYKALIENWSHKKVTLADCEAINELISSEKATADGLISSIVTISEQTPSDKRDFLKSVSSWLSSGSYLAKAPKPKGHQVQPTHLNRVNDEAGSAYLKHKAIKNHSEAEL